MFVIFVIIESGQEDRFLTFLNELFPNTTSFTIEKEVGAHYIGETSSSLTRRFRELMKHLDRYKRAKEELEGTSSPQTTLRGRPRTIHTTLAMEQPLPASAVAEHAAHCCGSLQTRVLCKESRLSRRRLKEAFFIQNNQYINRDRGTVEQDDPLPEPDEHDLGHGPAVVYNIRCGCNASCLGETGNTLLDRFKQHMSNVRRYEEALRRLKEPQKPVRTITKRRGRPQREQPQKIIAETNKASAVVEHSSQCSHDLQPSIICRGAIFTCAP
ncbi:hypothetical protein M513_09282 [Trichuris suis]|uniref:Uncharacterized protein n=1 Tax=Trichuris suis TaxID=68888 RepID=A0A085LXW9_9BILA|nr:hypothetical protein M513_09282 [Trichuris suis]